MKASLQGKQGIQNFPDYSRRRSGDFATRNDREVVVFAVIYQTETARRKRFIVPKNSKNFSLVLQANKMNRNNVRHCRRRVVFLLRPFVVVVLVLSSLCSTNSIVGAASTTAEDTTSSGDDDSAVTSCRKYGFDPWQLSCETCTILPYESSSPVIAKCMSCCQSYKTLTKRTQAYQGAILLHSDAAANFFPEIDRFVEEDVEKVLEQKGNDRFRVITFQGGGGGMFGRPQPSAILWLDDLPPSNFGEDGQSIYDLQNLAKETIILDGWKRDEVREMLLAILPDKQ